LLENLRTDPGEKTNDPQFAKFLASYGDIYVNDAFAASHREHASIVGIPAHLPSYAGLLMEEEIQGLRNALMPPKPYVFILGGAKFETKLPLIEKFMHIADTVFVGGALAHNILQARGYEIGASIVSEGDFALDEIAHSKSVQVPSEVVVRKGDEVIVKDVADVASDEQIVDAGAGTLADLTALIDKAQFVLWNGPLGYYEGGFDEGSNDLARIIGEARADSLVGGGDTLTAIHKTGVEEGFETISTGGGAMLEFLLNETLPGIDALEKRA